MAPDSEDISEPIFLKKLCTFSQNLSTEHFCNIRGHTQEDCSTGVLGFDFRTDHPSHSTERTGRSQGQKLVRTVP